MFHHRLAALLVAAVLGGCSNPDAGNSALQVSTRVLPISASPELGCEIPATLPPGGLTAVDTSVTPRANRHAEILAMEASAELVAPTALYRRVVNELAVLRSYGWTQEPFGCGPATEVLVGMTETGMQQVANGEYTAWNDYNTALRMTQMTQKFYGYKLTFGGVYNHAAVAQAYAALPEVRYAEPNGYFGGSVDVCLERFGDALDTHVYIYMYGSGDCQAGCINRTYYGFVTDLTGAMEYLGRYDSGRAEPDWFTKARQCRNFL